MESLNSNSQEREMHQLQQMQDKAKEKCIESFRLLYSHLKVLSIEGGFERACVALFDQDNRLSQNVESEKMYRCKREKLFWKASRWDYVRRAGVYKAENSNRRSSSLKASISKDTLDSSQLGNFSRAYGTLDSRSDCTGGPLVAPADDSKIGKCNLRFGFGYHIQGATLQEWSLIRAFLTMHIPFYEEDFIFKDLIPKVRRRAVRLMMMLRDGYDKKSEDVDDEEMTESDNDGDDFVLSLAHVTMDVDGPRQSKIPLPILMGRDKVPDMMVEDTHVTLTRLSCGQQQSSSVSLDSYDKIREESSTANQQFLETIDDGMKKIIKEHVKKEVSKIIPKVEKFVNDRLESESSGADLKRS
ncbi:hypothetical protein Tco_1163788 [Tanacetum coccineum]